MKKFLLSIFAVMLAVFSVQAEEVTYTVTSTSAVSVSGDIPEGSSATYNSTYSSKCQLTKGNSMTLTLKGYQGCKIVGITLSMKSNKSAGAGYYSMKVGNTTLSEITSSSFNNKKWNGSYTTEYTNIVPTMSNADYTIKDNESVVITINATTNSLYCQSFTIEYLKEGNVSQPKFSKESGSYAESFDLELTAEDGNKIYYTFDGTEPDENSSEYKNVAIPVKASVIVKAIAVDDEGKKSSVAQEEYIISSTSASGEYVKTTSLSDWTGNYLLVCEDGKVAFDGSLGTLDAVGNYINVEINNGIIAATSATRASSFNISKVTDGYAVQSNSGYYIGNDEKSNGLKSSKSTVYVNTITNGVVQGKGGYTLQYYSQTGSSRFRYYGTTQKAVSLYKFVAPEECILSVSDAEWATLYFDFALNIPESVKCYVVTEVSGESATLSLIENIIPANTAVIVEAAKGEYTFDVVEDNTEEIESIMLGTIMNKYITEEAYVLGVVDGEVGLYKAKMAGGVWLNNANKAYLPASVANGAASYSFRFGEGTTGISEVKTENGEVKAIYDLTGRKLKGENGNLKGIYIINGKKVLVK